MDTLQEELDRSFGVGPPLAAVDTHVVAGRRALRRRRVASGAVGVAAAAILVTGWYAVAPGATTGSDRLTGDPTSSSPSATPPPSTGTPTAPSTPLAGAPWRRGDLIRYVDGALEVRPGVVVHEHIENPYRLESGLSDALDVTWKGERRWLMIAKHPMPRGITSSTSDPSNGWASFADYVADQVEVDGGGDGWPDTFRLDDRGRVVPTAGTRVLDRTDDPRLGPSFAPAGATTGAAVVSVAGESHFVVWRVLDGTLDVITTPSTFIAGASFDDLLSDARARYTSGEGLR